MMKLVLENLVASMNMGGHEHLDGILAPKFETTKQEANYDGLLAFSLKKYGHGI